MPPEIRTGLAREGFLGVGFPLDQGGQGGGSREAVAVLEELAAASAAVATLVAVQLSVAAGPIAEWGTDAQRERFLRPLLHGDTLGAFGLTEPGVGSDTAHLSTRYERVENGYRLQGAKMFITNAASADLIVLFATRDTALGHRGISAFLVPRTVPGYSVAQHLDKLGIRGSETNELVLDSVVLPRDHLLGPEGGGLKIALGALTAGRVGIAACALGTARAAFEEMRAHALAEPADWKRTAVAQAFTELAAARALVERAADKKDRGEAFAQEASAAKLFAAGTVVRIASKGVDVAGPPGIRAGARAERLLRDARVFPIVEGTTEIQELILGRSLLEPEAGRPGAGSPTKAEPKALNRVALGR